MPDAQDKTDNDVAVGGESKPKAPSAADSPGFLAVIKELVALNPTAASLTLAGVAAFLGLGLVLTTGTGPQGNVNNVIFLLAAGVSITLVARVLDNQIYVQVLSFFIVFLLLAWIILFILSRSALAIYQPKDLDNELKVNVACMVEVFPPCAEVRDRWALYFQEKQTAESASKPKNPPPAPSVPPSTGNPPPASDSGRVPSPQKVSYRNPVTVQFAGTFVRSDVQSMMQKLRDAGWNMQGTDKGGERTSAAAGKRSIRYGADVSTDVAEELRRALSAFDIVPKNMTTERNPLVDPNSIEIWMGN